MAYCLLGLLDVNMALVYGGGTKAFVRLQEEPVRSCDDESILVWPVAAGRDDELHTLWEVERYLSDVPLHWHACQIFPLRKNCSEASLVNESLHKEHTGACEWTLFSFQSLAGNTSALRYLNAVFRAPTNIIRKLLWRCT